MTKWTGSAFECEFSTDCPNLLFAQVQALANRLGFNSCRYWIRMPIPISRPLVREFGAEQNVPPVEIDWRANALFDPPMRMEHGAATTNAGPWTQTMRDASGSIGRMMLGRDKRVGIKRNPVFDDVVTSWLAKITHERMVRILIPTLLRESQVSMTAREKDILRWTAEGKTAYEIARILAVSERTVNFHINNAVAKLGAANKVQAVVKATVLGMLL